ncbi:MAG: sulfatase [Planctomycetes bacterium]|nr:sulfatase [Planctomycetota bacterium]
MEIIPMMRFLAGMFLFSLLSASASAAESKPNFLVIFTDDQTFRAIGYNNPEIRTPTLDRLAREGVIFSHAYAASPICVASRASVMTGRFPQQHRTVGLDTASFLPRVESGKQKPLPAYLSGAGYVTALCGKSHLGDPRRYGFTAGKEHNDITDRQSLAFATDFLTQRGKDQQPFLLWFGMRQPHIPLRPEQKWLELYPQPLSIAPNFREAPLKESIYNQGLPGQAYYRDSNATGNYKKAASGPPRSRETIQDFTLAYYATISHLDHQVDELAKQLQQAGLADNTIIVYLSDNGYFLGNHGLGNKITMHEESVRVPMFFSGPKLPRHGVTCDQLVSSVDLLPTLLELAGVPRPEGLWGQSLVPQLTDPKRPLREYVVSECVGVEGKPGQGHRMVRTDRWKYVLTDVNDEALFDEQADTYELKNLAHEDSQRETLNKLRQMMRQWMTVVEDGHAKPPGE